MQLEGRNNEENADSVVYFSIIIVVYFSITIYKYIPAEDAFHIDMDRNYKIRREWEVQGRNSTIECKDVFNAALVNNVPDVYYTTYNNQGDKIKVKDTDAMQLCAAKIETIRNVFEDCLTNLPIERKDALVQLYNERFNCFVRPKYDGSHQTFPGLSFASSTTTTCTRHKRMPSG